MIIMFRINILNFLFLQDIDQMLTTKSKATLKVTVPLEGPSSVLVGRFLRKLVPEGASSRTNYGAIYVLL